MGTAELRTQLIELAHGLRAPNAPFASVLEIAYHAGASVWLHLHTSPGSPSAQLDLLHRPPKIILYRASKVNGERRLRPEEDDLLTPRERFSVAHELGHWIAFRHLSVSPQAQKEKYWEQERAINAFAGYLLAPDWFVGEWLTQIPQGCPIPPSALSRWAASRRGVSEDVIATALARRRRSIGFLKLIFTQDVRHTGVLEVLASIAGDGLRLPARQSYIREPRILRLLHTNVSGVERFDQLILGKCDLRDLRMSWCRTSGRKVIWVSFATLVGGPGLVPTECESCGAPVSDQTVVSDDRLPYSVFCCQECCEEALLALPFSSPDGRWCASAGWPVFDDQD